MQSNLPAGERLRPSDWSSTDTGRVSVDAAEEKNVGRLARVGGRMTCSKVRAGELRSTHNKQTAVTADLCNNMCERRLLERRMCVGGCARGPWPRGEERSHKAAVGSCCTCFFKILCCEVQVPWRVFLGCPPTASLWVLWVNEGRGRGDFFEEKPWVLRCVDGWKRTVQGAGNKRG